MSTRSEEKEGRSEAPRAGKSREGGAVHRVGSGTLGVLLVLFGILFLIHLFYPALEYQYIFRLWPVVLIGMGLEVLASTIAGHNKFSYDWGAVVMLMILLVFSMCMAGADWAMRCRGYNVVIW